MADQKRKSESTLNSEEEEAKEEGWDDLLAKQMLMAKRKRDESCIVIYDLKTTAMQRTTMSALSNNLQRFVNHVRRTTFVIQIEQNDGEPSDEFMNYYDMFEDDELVNLEGTTDYAKEMRRKCRELLSEVKSCIEHEDIRDGDWYQYSSTGSVMVGVVFLVIDQDKD